ncbi:MAG TPA: HlyD family efflux transporter periplasmic adaptor subunit [Gammaproteobacteria bacterium]|nr:HlyD family efflux transporter periplasmic adaptor subunit [Gammaproteobacteria bacterium]
MRKTILLTALLALAAGYGAGYHHSRPAADGLEAVAAVDSAARYVCPMHANIVADHPDQCPVCGMDLVPARRPEAEEPGAGGGPAALPVVEVEPAVVHNLGVRTAMATRGDLPRRIETIGKITRIDPMARRTLSPPIRGELVYVADKQQGDFVDDGELLFSVKSDVLFEHEKAFQSAFQSGDRATAAAMVPQLSRMGLSSEQIARLQAGEAPEMPVEVRAFEDGIVYTRRGRPGEAVHTGFTVFNVGGNYRVVDVTAEIFERQWGWVEEGQKAYMEVRGLPGVRFEGTVVRVEPPVGYTTRSLEVGLRFRTDNAALSQSMFAHVSILGQPRRGVLLVPADAVIRTGRGDRVVKVLDAGRFQPVPVVAGEESGGRVEIRSGLAEGDRVVASGQFLIDSESNIQAGFRRMATPGTAPVQEARQHDAAPPPAPLRPAPPAPPAGDGGLPVSAPSAARPPPPV